MKVKSADRTILIIEAVAEKKDGISHRDLSVALNIPKSSLTSLLATLQARDYLYLDTLSKRYFLGPQILFLAGHYLSRMDLVQLGQSIVNEFVNETDESTGLTILNGWQLLTVYNKNCRHPIMGTLRIGDRAPLYATAAGKSILAFMEDNEIEQYLASVKMLPLTPRTMTRAEQIWKEIKLIRKNGVSFCYEEYQQGSTAMAAPIFDVSNKAVASLHVVMPKMRFTAEKKKSISGPLKRAAVRLSKRMGSSRAWDSNDVQPAYLNPVGSDSPRFNR